MHLGQNAFTIASHLTMVIILTMLAVRALRHRTAGLNAVIAIAAMGLVIERIYYVAARSLLSSGVNLWSMHPAPSILSMVVGIGLYSVMVPMVYSAQKSRRRAVARITVEIGLLFGIWALVARALY